MALGDPHGKPQDRLNSVSPKRDKARQKPRKDWLVAVGQGISPASTRSGSGTTARKKVDPKKLSFTGLEHEGRKSQHPSSPTSAPTRLKKPSPSFLPPYVTAPISSKVITPPFLSPTRTGQAAAGDESTLEGCGCGTPQTNETTAGIVGSTERGDNSLLYNVDSRDASLRSLAFFSPGKEYWAGRIAGSPRNSDSPTARSPRKKKNMETQGMSPTGNFGRRVFGSKGGQKLRLGVPVSSLPSGDPLAMVLPGIQTNGSSHSSAWSTQASIFSSLSGSTLSPSPRVTRRYDLSPSGKITLPRSGRALPGDAMGGKASNAHKKVRMGAASISPTSLSSSGRAPHSRSSEPQAFNRNSVLAKRGKSSSPMGRSKPSNHNRVHGGATSSNSASSSRLGHAPRGLGPVEKHPDMSNGKGGRTASVNMRKATRRSFFPQTPPKNLGSVAIPPARVVSPSSLPSITADVYHEKKSPERTTPPRECPEITVVSPRNEDMVVSPSCLGRREGAPEGSAANGVSPSGGGSIKDNAEEECVDYDGETGTEEYNDHPARPLHNPPVSPASREPSPRTPFGEHATFADDMRQACPNSKRRWSQISDAASERPSASREDEEVPIKMHLPPGVRTEALHVLGASRSGASVHGLLKCRDEVGANSRVFLSTPTGDGGAADLSLWITVREAQNTDGDSSAISSCPSRNYPAEEESASRDPYRGRALPAPEGGGLVAAEEVMVNDMVEDRSLGLPEGEGLVVEEEAVVTDMVEDRSVGPPEGEGPVAAEDVMANVMVEDRPVGLPEGEGLVAAEGAMANDRVENRSVGLLEGGGLVVEEEAMVNDMVEDRPVGPPEGEGLVATEVVANDMVEDRSVGLPEAEGLVVEEEAVVNDMVEDRSVGLPEGEGLVVKEEAVMSDMFEDRSVGLPEAEGIVVEEEAVVNDMVEDRSVGLPEGEGLVAAEVMANDRVENRSVGLPEAEGLVVEEEAVVNDMIEDRTVGLPEGEGLDDEEEAVVSDMFEDRSVGLPEAEGIVVEEDAVVNDMVEGRSVGLPEAEGIVVEEEAVVNDMVEDRSVGRREDIECGLGHRWSSFVQAFFGLLDFCRPRESNDHDDGMAPAAAGVPQL